MCVYWGWVPGTVMTQNESNENGGWTMAWVGMHTYVSATPPPPSPLSCSL